MFFREEIANMRYTTRYNYWRGFLQFMHVNPFQSQIKWNKRNHPLGPFIWNRVTSPLVPPCLIYTSVKCKCWGTKANLEPLLNLGSNELFNIVREFRGEQDQCSTSQNSDWVTCWSSSVRTYLQEVFLIIFNDSIIIGIFGISCKMCKNWHCCCLIAVYRVHPPTLDVSISTIQMRLSISCMHPILTGILHR